MNEAESSAVMAVMTRGECVDRRRGREKFGNNSRTEFRLEKAQYRHIYRMDTLHVGVAAENWAACRRTVLRRTSGILEGRIVGYERRHSLMSAFHARKAREEGLSRRRGCVACNVKSTSHRPCDSCILQLL